MGLGPSRCTSLPVYAGGMLIEHAAFFCLHIKEL